MDLAEMIALVRIDLYEKDPDYRWAESDLERHIARAVKDYSLALPLEDRYALPTTPGSREISLAGLADCVTIEAVEYPVGRHPAGYRRYFVWNDTLTLSEGEVPDGSDCNIYYGRLHRLDAAGSSIPSLHEDLIAAGTCGYAAMQMAGYTINRVNVGGRTTPAEWLEWSQEKLAFFRAELKRLGRRNRVRVSSLYLPCCPPLFRSRDWER